MPTHPPTHSRALARLPDNPFTGAFVARYGRAFHLTPEGDG